MDKNWPHYSAAQIAARILEEAGFEAYIIGGAVRDILLGHVPKDFDLATDATPEQILKQDGFQKSHYKDTSGAYGVTRVYIEVPYEDGSMHDIELEIATYRRDLEAHRGRKDTKVAFANLEEDVERRDFTVNALALNPDTQQLIDLVDGLDDIEHQILRFIGDPASRIQEDPVRMLRAVRLKNQLDFHYGPGVEAALQDAVQRGELQKIAAERVQFELTRMLMLPRRRFALQDLDNSHILENLLPEVAAQKGVLQPSTLHAEGDVWRHCLLAMEFLPDIVSPRLAWATLLHDIGKVGTSEDAATTGDRIRFSDHHALGAEQAKDILRRLRFGKRFRQEVVWLVHNHLTIDDLPHMRDGRARQFMSHPAFADLLELHKADAHAAWSKTDDGQVDRGPADFSEIERIWQQFQEEKHQHPPSLKHDLGVDGAWLIKHYDLRRGPEMGPILRELEELYLDGEITDSTSAHTKTRAILSRHQETSDQESASE